jgi:hypothetical protein
MKHIEQILPEYAAGDLSRLLVSDADATASAALTALLHSVTGCAIPPTADTPESEVEELVPLCLSILRRHWTTPLTALGDGTTPMSLADLMRRLIGDRVQGNEAWSIPAIHADIPTAVSALLARDMSSGLTLTLTDGTDGSTPTTTSQPDGLSLAQLLCSGLADNITELRDDNKGWTMTKALTFPNLEKILLGCVKATTSTGIPATAKSVVFPYLEDFDRGVLMVCDGDGEISFPNLRHIRAVDSNTNTINLKKAKKLVMPSLVNVESIGNTTFCTGAELEEIEWKSFVGYGPQTWGGWAYLIGGCPNLKKVVFGTLQYSLKQNNANSSILSLGENCGHLEFGEGTAVSLMLDTWNPTTALSERLPEFLSNFKTYIAQRLTDNGSGLTLTLSPAVYESIWDADGNPLDNPICQAIDEIMTNKKWDINKA